MYLIEDETEIVWNSLPPNCSTTVPTVPPPIEAPEAFNQAFQLVMANFHCSPAEMKAAKQAALADWENALLCYVAMEQEILGPAQGINERIRASIGKDEQV